MGFASLGVRTRFREDHLRKAWLARLNWDNRLRTFPNPGTFRSAGGERYLLLDLSNR